MSTATPRPHVIGVDDGPFRKDQREPVPVVAVTMAGCDLVEGVAISSFPVDGPDATGFLAEWINELRVRPSLRALVLGGITIAGLGVVDITALARRLELPVITVTRAQPRDEPLLAALEAAGLPDRRSIVTASPRAFALDEGLFVAHAGIAREDVAGLIGTTIMKAQLPEPVRLAHLIGRALVTGQSHGRA
ncbi:MAG: DUF99 family protein [Planctomycetes bacterium]|nr:DUF99 family protein [Planctomycetota bacterium]